MFPTKVTSDATNLSFCSEKKLYFCCGLSDKKWMENYIKAYYIPNETPGGTIYVQDIPRWGKTEIITHGFIYRNKSWIITPWEISLLFGRVKTGMSSMYYSINMEQLNVNIFCRTSFGAMMGLDKTSS